MLGVLLATFGAFFEELSSSIGKEEVKRKEESVYAMGFLNALWGVFFFFVLMIFFRRSDPMTFAAWPTFILRSVFSILQGYLTVNAIAKSDRSTFGFIRTGTIPLLLAADIVLGYVISGYQILGMLLISGGLLFLYVNHGLSKKGRGFVILSTLNAALTIGLYKYNITHGNSVVLEQFLSCVISVAFFYVMSRFALREHPFKLLKKPVLAFQSGATGAAAVLESFAYIFAPASVILAATRSATVFFTMLSGRVMFHEKHVMIKAFSSVALAVGIIMLALQV